MPSLLATILKGAANDLVEAGVPFAVVDGLAVGAQAVLRHTQDVDLAVAVADDPHAEQVGGFLIRRGYRPITELDQQAVGRLATLRLLSPRLPANIDPSDAPLLDLIFSSCGIEPEVAAAAQHLKVLPGLTLPTARIPHLIAMKVLSESDIRLQDRLDLQALIAAATDDDLDQVPRLLDLITDRGYARGKNLRGIFLRMRESNSP